jgi:hypothetical protein
LLILADQLNTKNMLKRSHTISQVFNCVICSKGEEAIEIFSHAFSVRTVGQD